MRLDIITLFPKMLSSFFDESILKRAQNKQLVDVHFHDSTRSWTMPPARC